MQWQRIKCFNWRILLVLGTKPAHNWEASVRTLNMREPGPGWGPVTRGHILLRSWGHCQRKAWVREGVRNWLGKFRAGPWESRLGYGVGYLWKWMVRMVSSLGWTKSLGPAGPSTTLHFLCTLEGRLQARHTDTCADSTHQQRRLCVHPAADVSTASPPP